MYLQDDEEALDLASHPLSAEGGPSRKVTIQQSAREPSVGTKLAGTFTWDIPVSRPGKKINVWCSSSGGGVLS